MENYTGRIVGVARDFMYRVYGWMAMALAITAGTAVYVYKTPDLLAAINSPGAVMGLIIGQLALVLFLGFMLEKMNFTTAVLAFLAYSLLTGLTLSSIFLVFTQASIVATFVVTAGMFGIMALYGYFTNEDLSSMQNIVMMGLVGLIIGLFINLFLRSSAFDFVLSGIGVVIFAMLTAYDVQKIKQFGQSMFAHGQMANKVAIMGALMLYLDFVNLFLFLLRFVGQKKEG